MTLVEKTMHAVKQTEKKGKERRKKVDGFLNAQLSKKKKNGGSF
jgi:hypothetical protein